MPIINRFAFLLSERERKENRTITYEDIHAATGIAPSTLSRWSRNRITKFDAETLDSLCDYLDCELCDLLVRVEE
jgi:putative transcriptional regulator